MNTHQQELTTVVDEFFQEPAFQRRAWTVDEPSSRWNRKLHTVGLDGPEVIPDDRSTCTEEYWPSSDEIAGEVASIESISLSPALQEWVSAYESVGERPEYLWKWCHRGVELTTLPCVPNEERDELADTKVLGVMLDVLMDDVADEGRDEEFLEYLISLPFGQPAHSARKFSRRQREYAEITASVWSEIQRRLHTSPRFEEFRAQLRFDYHQLFNAMRYSYLLNSDPALLNLTEHDLYLPHNMHMMVSATMDLMFSPRFRHDELGPLREAVSRMQIMGRIGNLITTWEREISQGDYSSGVFAAAVSDGALRPRDMDVTSSPAITAVIQEGNYEQFFLRRWQRMRQELLMLRPRLQSVDLDCIVNGMQRLLCLHLGSRGHK